MSALWTYEIQQDIVKKCGVGYYNRLKTGGFVVFKEIQNEGTQDESFIVEFLDAYSSLHREEGPAVLHYTKSMYTDPSNLKRPDGVEYYLNGKPSNGTKLELSSVFFSGTLANPEVKIYHFTPGTEDGPPKRTCTVLKTVEAFQQDWTNKNKL